MSGGSIGEGVGAFCREDDTSPLRHNIDDDGFFECVFAPGKEWIEIDIGNGIGPQFGGAYRKPDVGLTTNYLLDLLHKSGGVHLNSHFCKSSIVYLVL